MRRMSWFHGRLRAPGSARRVAVAVVALAGMALSAAPAVAAPHTQVPASPVQAPLAAAPADQVVNDVLKAINDERTSTVAYEGGPKRPMKPLTLLSCTSQQAADRVVTQSPTFRGTSSGLAGVQSACGLDGNRLAGDVGPAAASGAAIVDLWMANPQTQRNILGADTNVGIGCRDTGASGWLCEAIFSNPARPSSLQVTIFGDSYTSGNGVGDGIESWRGDPTTQSFQSPQSQGHVMANLLHDWTQLPVDVQDYSHSGSITASKASEPFVVAPGTLPTTLMRRLLNNGATTDDALMKLLDDPSATCVPVVSSWNCGGADTWARGDTSATRTLEEQIVRAEQDSGNAMLPQGVSVFGIGGNDIAFARIAQVMMVLPFSEPQAREALASAEGLIQPAVVREQTQLVRLIMDSSPNSVILVQGYPYLADAGGTPTIYGVSNQGTKTQYQPGPDLRAFQDEAENRFQTMVNSSDVQSVAQQFGVEVRFVPYAKATDGQAPYLADGSANPNRGITTAFEVGDDHAFCGGVWCSHMNWVHPAARLRAQEGNLLFSSLVQTPLSQARQTFLGQVTSDTSDRDAPKLLTPAGVLDAGTVSTPYGLFLEASGVPAPAFAVTGGALPEGLKLYPSGNIGGTPTRAGDYTLQVTVSNTALGVTRTDSAEYTLHVDPAGPDVLPGLTVPATLPTATVGVPFVFAPQVTGSPAPTFSVSGDLPPGLSMYPGTGVITGTPALPGDYPVTLTASNTILGQTRTGSVTFTIHVDVPNASPVATADTPPVGMVGAPYTFAVQATGSPAPTFAVTDGTLPPGLELDPATGTLSGTPTAAGEYAVTVTASNTVDGQPQSDSVELTFQIEPPVLQAPVITSGAAPATTVGATYAFTVEATGDPAPTFAVTDGALPDGLTLDPVTGAITGIPTTVGDYAATVTATSTLGDQTQSASVELTIRVGPAAPEPASPVISAGTVPVGTVGLPYTFAFEATGNPAPTFEVTEGTLPPGLSLDPVTGTVSGTPALPGDRTVTVTASNTVDGQTQSDSVEVTFHVVLPEAAPTITSGDAPTGTVGDEYAFTVTATGNPAPTFAVTDGALPDGLSLDALTGDITGTPAVDGEFPVTVTASNTVAGLARSDSVRLTIVVDPAGLPDAPPAIVAGTAPAGTVGVAYAFTVRATGRPAPTFEVTEGTLPLGLSLDPATGTVSGTPALPGDSTVTITASSTVDGQTRSDSAQYTIHVDLAGTPPVVTTDAAPAATAGVAYAFTVEATGSPAPTFEVTDGTLPDGLVLDPVTGTVSGTPTTAGEYPVTLTASNTFGGQVRSDSVRLTIVVALTGVADVPPTIVAGPAPAGTVDVAYTFTVQATGSPAPTFAVTAGDLPAGLSLDPVTGTIAGTPTAAGDFTVTVTASNTVDGQTRTDSARFTLHVDGRAAPTPTDSPTSTASPTSTPTASPTTSPTASPTISPTASPTDTPTSSPTSSPTGSPTTSPTASPTDMPSTPAPSPSPTSTAPGGTTTHLPLTGAGGTVAIAVVAGMALLLGLAAVAARRRRLG